MTPASFRYAAPDADARRLIRESLGESMIVEAAAGTGKTTVLVERIAAILAAGLTTIDRVVAVTFTRKAAGELKLRLRLELDRQRRTAAPAARRHLEAALEHLEEASIGTIHSFCAEILRTRPAEARIDPAFTELNETQAARLLRRVFDRWVQDKLNQDSPVLRRVLTRATLAETQDDRSPLDDLFYAVRELAEWRDFPAPWRQSGKDYRAWTDELAACACQLEANSRHPRNPLDPLRAALRPLTSFVTWLERAEAHAPRDYDAVEAMLLRMQRELRRVRKTGRGYYSDHAAREQIAASRDLLLEALEQFRAETGADLAAALRDELREVVELYQQAKRRLGALDFLDLLIAVRDLVRGDAGARAYLAGERFSHIFVDEFQDTDPLQAEILLLLAARDPAVNDWRQAVPAPGKLFLVGDPKQSIYRFRRADVLFYQEVTRALHGHGVRVLFLNRSFRAVSFIQRAVNAAFAAHMTGDEETGQPGYVPLAEHRPSPAEQPAVVVLPAPRPYGPHGISASAIEESLPEAVAAFVDWLLRRSGWTVADPEDPGRRVPLAPRHVCILFRRFVNWGEDVSRPYVRKLEARGIAHVLVAGKSFHQREEVETLRAALAAIEWPHDELAVYATLRGSLFAFSDAMLFHFRQAGGSWNPLRPRPDGLPDEYAPLGEALDLLASLHRRRNHQPVVSTLSALLEATRAHAAFAWRPGGHQILTNVYRLLDLARNYEAEGGLSFRGFVDELDARAEAADSAEAPIVEEGAEGVRLMTVHSAKGLEFPVVLLADLTAKLATRQADRYLDPRRGLCALRLGPYRPWELLEHHELETARDRAEGVRLAYVAATRARDLLVIPAVGDEAYAGWLAPLHEAIYPPAPARRAAHPAPGCPAFGPDSVCERPRGGSRDSVQPGLHHLPGDYPVVWWDPHTLDLDREETFGLIHESLLEDAGETDDERRYEAWKQAVESAARAGARPQFDIFTATDPIPLPPDARAPVAAAEVEREAERPGGRRFGTLVHALLRDLPLEANERQLELAARARGRLHGATEEETAAARVSAARALTHPLLERARQARRVLREAPVLLALDGQRLFEGVIDLAFEEPERWVIVDYKTDEGALPVHYRQQLGWYVYTVARLTGKPAEGWLLHV
jgi:ATP-dependent helicase/nuclease subunit A